MTARGIPGMVKEALRDWREDDAPRLGAALSYYTIFSIAPLLVISIAVAGYVFGPEAAQGRIVAQLRGLLGEAGAEAIQAMIESARKPRDGLFATVAGLVALILGATGVFGELRAALNTVWEVPRKPGGGLWGLVRDRLLSFTLVLAIGFLLLVSLVLSAGVAALDGPLGVVLPETGAILQVVSSLVSLCVVTALFALIFKMLPDADPPVAWKDVWVGAFMTAVLFTVGKLLIGLYLGRSTVSSAFGAAGSLVVVLVWVYYAAQIFFFGAELTQVWAHRYGSRAQAPARGEAAPAARGDVPGGPLPARSAKDEPAATTDAGEESYADEDEDDLTNRPAAARTPWAGGLVSGVLVSAVVLVLGFLKKKDR